MWQQLPRVSTATPGLTWPCLSACVQGERYLVNPTPERLLHGAGAGSALGRLRQSCPCSLARFSLSTDTSPQYVASRLWAFSLSRAQTGSDSAAGKHSQGCVGHRPHGWAGKGRGHKWDGCFSPAEGPTVSEMLTKAFNATREGYQRSSHRLKFRVWRKKLEQIYQI